VQTRVYLPLTVSELRRLGRDGTLAPAPIPAYAVTVDLRRERPGADEEELEYLAFLDAAGSGTAGTVRVVAAADVDADAVEELLAREAPVSEVRVTVPVPMRHVASLHVAEGPVATAAGNGIPDLASGFSWYDATELDVVVDLLT
jgi:hypothetical protein